MKNKRFLVLIAMLSLVGMSALLVACGGSTGDTSGSSDAQKQFLADRGSGTPGTAVVTPGANGQTGTGGGFAGVFGTIDKIEGNKITVKNAATGNSTTVELATDGKIFKQATLAASDIKVGDTILAAGTRNGTAIDANTVEVGDLSNLQAGGGRIAGGFPGAGQGGGQFPQGTPGAGRTPGVRRGQGTPGAARTPRVVGTPGVGNRGGFGTPVIGTVEKIEGDTITITPITQSNATPTTATATPAPEVTTVRLTSTTRIQKQAEIALTDLKVGNSVTASGTQNGDVFDATRLKVNLTPRLFQGQNANTINNFEL